MFNVNLPSFSLKLLPLVLSLQGLVKSLSPSLKGCNNISPESSHLQAEQPKVPQLFS